MSGGRPSGPQTAVGDHPSCTSKARKDGETAGCARSHSEGLGLDGGGVADPNKKEERKSADQAGIRYAQGMEADRPRLWLGSRQPDTFGVRFKALNPVGSYRNIL